MVAVDYNEKNSGSSLKFLCSYGGKILPRSTDGKLPYVGDTIALVFKRRSISEISVLRYAFTAELSVAGVTLYLQRIFLENYQIIDWKINLIVVRVLYTKTLDSFGIDNED